MVSWGEDEILWKNVEGPAFPFSNSGDGDGLTKPSVSQQHAVYKCQKVRQKLQQINTERERESRFESKEEEEYVQERERAERKA